MPILLKIRFTFKEGREEDFKTAQAKLMTVMLNHPGKSFRKIFLASHAGLSLTM
jgi:hypothetical protein